MAPKVNRHHHQQQHDIGVLGYEDNNPPSSPSSERPPEYYEDAGVNIGAPTEMISPLGYHVDSISVVFLNVGKIIGTGVFSTPGSILRSSGSVGLSFVLWVVGFFFAGASLSVLIEFATYFPHRSGAEVVYLEKSYPRPRYFLPTAFAVQAVLLSFSSSNAIVLAKYILAACGTAGSPWQMRGLAVGMFTVIVGSCIVNTRLSLQLSNIIGFVKLIILAFIGITGIVVLCGGTRVPNPTENFRNAFAGTTSNGNGLATALIKVNFAYSGFENAFAVVNEIKNPARTLKLYTPLSLALVFVLYMFANVAYFAAIPKEDIRASGEMTARLFFIAVFGSTSAANALSALVAVSALGNILSVVIGTSRVIRECGRQGVIPFPGFWASTKPFNTPLGPYLLKYVLTVIVIIAPPAGDAFNFIVDLQSYPTSLFAFLTTLGLFLVRRRRLRIGAPRNTEFVAWNWVLIFALIVNACMLIMPWVPPKGGIYAGDVSFFYGTYCIVGLGIIAVCGIYYVIWIKALPRWGGYAIRQVIVAEEPEAGEAGSGGGTKYSKFIKVPREALARWEREHDSHGNFIGEVGRPEEEAERTDKVG